MYDFELLHDRTTARIFWHINLISEANINYIDVKFYQLVNNIYLNIFSFSPKLLNFKEISGRFTFINIERIRETPAKKYTFCKVFSTHSIEVGSFRNLMVGNVFEIAVTVKNYR